MRQATRVGRQLVGNKNLLRLGKMASPSIQSSSIISPNRSLMKFHHNFYSRNQSTENTENTENQKSTITKNWWKWALGAGAFYLVYESINEIFLPLAERETTVHLSVSEQDDEAYYWLMSYFAQHPYTQNCRHISVLSQDNRAVSNMLGGLFGALGAFITPNQSDSNEPVLYTPVDGVRHFFTYKGRLMWLYIEKIVPGGEEKKTKQSLKITMLSRDRKLLTDLVEEARNLYKKHKKDKTVIYVPSTDCFDWEELARKPKRPLESLVLKDKMLDEIVTDLKSFVDSASFYYSRGIPYRRGIMLQGPPGTGKSSTVMTIAGELGMDIYILNVSSTQLNDEKLGRLLHKAPHKSIVLVEDVDSCYSAVSKNRDERNDIEQHVSVSGLLNSIDGLGAQEGRIMFFTTNHPEKLNTALIRPGRVDRKFHIGYAEKDQIEKLFANFYKDESGKEDVKLLAEQFANKVTQDNISPAQLQGFFMKYKGQPRKALENVDALHTEQ